VANLVGLQDPERLRAGLRALCCGNARDWTRFDALFDAYWHDSRAATRTRIQGGAGRTAPAQPRTGAGASTRALADEPGRGDPAEAKPEGPQGGASAEETTATQDFQALVGEAQRAAMEERVEALARRLRRLRIRRERLQRTGRRLHLRGTLRANLAYGGDPRRRVYRARQRRPPRLLLITDVSRSMALYSLFFLRFARGLVTTAGAVEAFAIHTRLVPVTEALRQPDTHRVRERLALYSAGWSGGTRLGESLATLNRDYGRRVNRRTLVILVSDGLDTGEPGDLARQLAILRGRARRLVWLNPLLGRPGYEPRSGGMRAALPYIDLFAPAHNLESIAALEPALAEL
jgi:uncharacterized protein with von Willebrand factor type A (vWA) domain